MARKKKEQNLGKRESSETQAGWIFLKCDETVKCLDIMPSKRYSCFHRQTAGLKTGIPANRSFLIFQPVT
jgi:hypothetical protein